MKEFDAVANCTGAGGGYGFVFLRDRVEGSFSDVLVLSCGAILGVGIDPPSVAENLAALEALGPQFVGHPLGERWEAIIHRLRAVAVEALDLAIEGAPQSAVLQ